jgi:hypothetical protein
LNSACIFQVDKLCLKVKDETILTKEQQPESGLKPVKMKKDRKPKAKKTGIPVPGLRFAEPGNDGFAYAQGEKGRFAIGSSKHHGTAFGLYYKGADVGRFKFIKGFESQIEAEKEASAMERTLVGQEERAPYDQAESAS